MTEHLKINKGVVWYFARVSLFFEHTFGVDVINICTPFNGYFSFVVVFSIVFSIAFLTFNENKTSITLK